MRVFLLTSLVTLLVSFSSSSSFAQSNNPASGPAQIELAQPDWYRNMVSSTGAQPHRGSEPRVLKKGPLAPSDEDRAAYAGFLAQRHTGLIRLLPRDQSKNADVKINGGGAYYSFAFLSHEYGYGSALELGTIRRFQDGHRLPAWYQFNVGFAGADYGMMTTVADIPLESITVADPPALFLYAYHPPRREAEARSEALAFRQGRLVKLQLYQSHLPVQFNTTYLLRSINYDVSDVLVAFRVLRQDPDAGVTIAWKLLKRYDPVRLER